MYEKGQYIVYGIRGVCRCDDLSILLIIRMKFIIKTPFGPDGMINGDNVCYLADSTDAVYG